MVPSLREVHCEQTQALLLERTYQVKEVTEEVGYDGVANRWGAPEGS